MNVYLRDTQHLVEVLLMAWFWAVPAVYRFPQTVHDKLEAHRHLRDPRHASSVAVFRESGHTAGDDVPEILLRGSGASRRRSRPTLPIEVLPVAYTPMWYLTADLVVIGVSVVMFLVAMVVFGRLEGNFAEEL